MKPGQIIYRGKTEEGLDILIRYPKSSDAALMMNFINTLSKEKTFIRFQGELVSLSEETKYLKNLLQRIKKREVAIILAFSDGKLIGISDIVLMDKIEKHVGIFGLTIAKEFRGKGVGRLLMKLVLEQAVKNIPLLRIITLGVFDNNPVAIAMYKKFGFKEYGKLPEGILHKGKYIDHIYMYKKIK